MKEKTLPHESHKVNHKEGHLNYLWALCMVTMKENIYVSSHKISNLQPEYLSLLLSLQLLYILLYNLCTKYSFIVDVNKLQIT